MAELKMPELNSVIVAGNLTKDPIFRQTSNSTPVVNFHIAVNRRYKDSANNWQEDVCYVGVVAWNKLADSCKDRLVKGSAVLIDGELQSRTFKTEDGKNRTVVEIKAKRIQFLNKYSKLPDDIGITQDAELDDSSFEDNSFDKFLTDEESSLIKD
ncbi:MAG TPA: single-stranded DNA-binding protein [Melioribacteraceae bacterium]|nr:single-stranded DNA-binding protein [Melioribacteraceae bacterium]